MEGPHSRIGPQLLNEYLCRTLAYIFWGYDLVDISSHLNQKYRFVFKHLEPIFLHNFSHGRISENIQLSLRQKSKT